jgi:hypothetical protein
MRKIDHNRTMLDREAHFKVPLPFKMISEYRSRQGIRGEAGAAGGVLMKKDIPLSVEDVLLCRGLLHEVLTFFEGEKG